MTDGTKGFVAFGALSLAVATIAGAAASHALGSLDARSLSMFETAVRFQFYHGLALLVVPLLRERFGRPLGITLAAWAFVAGTLLFCGTLYARALGAPPVLGSLAPIGGSAFILGWIALAVGVTRGR
ncbi:MAG TPA: DUF423 domain-containing protein [Gammaproteobacteria bacterium]